MCQRRRIFWMDLLKVPLCKIKLATKDFSEEYHVGGGAFGEVYKAKLDFEDIQTLLATEGKCKDGPSKIIKNVAIKRISSKANEKGRQGFEREIELLTNCKHQNIVSLLGYCDENDELILVYEFAVNGSLGDYLLNNYKTLGALTWTQRLQICLDAANGINYLHTDMEGKRRIIHRDIKSDNILLCENFNAKIADFGLSKFYPMKQQASTIYAKSLVGTPFYIDPEYSEKFKYKRETDIYSFGVVLFEVLCGRLAYDPIYTLENPMGLAAIARRRFEDGTLKELIDPKLTEEDHNDIFSLNRWLNENLYDTFSKIAYQCLAETQTNRPTMQVVIQELQKALHLQEYKSATNNFSTILSTTNNFADENLITKDALGKVYKGQLLHHGNLMNFAVRRFDCTCVQGDELQMEISMLKSLKHKNIISVLGHYDSDDEMIITYEEAFHGTLDQHLSDPTLTWSRRLQICLGVARAISHIHYDVIHCDINSSKIFLDKDWEPKIYGFEHSTKFPPSLRHRLLYSRCFKTNNMTPKYDVYSFGVLLLEVLCGRKLVITNDCVQQELDEIIDPNLRKQMDTQALALLKNIAYNCLNQHPYMDQIVKELEEVLDLQWKHADESTSSNSLKEHLKGADEGRSSNGLKIELLKIPLREILQATNNFHEAYIVGSGGYGVVYKAELNVLDIQCLSSMEGMCREEVPKIRKVVAIKRFHGREDEQGLLTEIESLSSCKHHNIVSLLGFSREAGEMILVYEFAPKGSLCDYLQNYDNAVNLTWVQRLQLCLDIAHGINYLHTNMKGKSMISHRDIKSENILLDENMNAKVGDFGLSKLRHTRKQGSTIYTKHIAGTMCYIDPDYLTTGKYKRESYVYSFGVVLFEVLSGRVAYDSIYINENELGLAPIARQHFNDRTLKALIDPKLLEEDDDHIFTLNRGPNQDSFSAFVNIAYRCLAKKQSRRPTMEVVIRELQNALNLQGDAVVLSRFLLCDIELATKNFAQTYCTGLDTNGTLYMAELNQFGNNYLLATEGKNNDESSKRITVVIKRITNRKSRQRKQGFSAEFEMRAYKHPNIVSLLGFCDEGDERILVYEHASSRSLDDYLKSIDNMDNFTWAHRLHLCLEIARGLNHLRTKMVNQSIIRTDIRSANILLDKNCGAKIAYFVISNLHTAANQEIGIKVYEDPYETTDKLKKESDIYSFGVVLFEIFCGRVAYDPVYIVENNEGLAPIARQCFKDGTIKGKMDPKLREENDEDISTSKRGPNKYSLDAFLKIAYQCLGEAAKRPTMEMVIKELEIALNFHEIFLKNLQISFKDIKSATENFSEENCIGTGRFWKVYKGELPFPQDNANANVNGFTNIAAKRWDRKFGQGDQQFRTEYDILFKCRHANIIGLVGYCIEMDEKIVVYEHMSNGSLDKHLKDINLTWRKRLEICIDVASGLEFLHQDFATRKKVVHRDIKSASILLNGDWKAKISYLELSSFGSLNPDMGHVSNTFGYLDPQYRQGFLTEKSDIYSFGVILFEILCGRLAWVDDYKDQSKSLGSFAKKCYEERKLDEIVFVGIKEQIGPKSLATFADIAYQCLDDKNEERPTASEVVIQLKKALDVQVSSH